MWISNGGPPTLLLIALGWWTGTSCLVLAGGVLLTHIELDRTLGHDLKLPIDFRDTHLGRIGKG